MKKYLFLTGILFLLCTKLHAQELNIVSFQRLDRDLLARTQERLDLNEEPCAIVRVSIPDSKDYTFEGNIIGEVGYRPGEAIIYMTSGSRNITIKSDRFGSLKYDFSERLEKQVVYKLTLKLIQSESNKTRTLVMPVASIGSTSSYGAMIGVVKKWGAYAKAKYNFKSLTTEGECDDLGMTNGNQAWFTGKSESTRLAVTGGLLYRAALPFYLYAGGGFGYKKLGWENSDGIWLENIDQSFNGFEAELGCIFRMKNFAISAGVQSNSFKYYEANLGIGLMF